MNSGIYCFENLLNGKKYVGQSINITKRKKHHYAALKNGYEDCVVLKNAWEKYGEENFLFRVIEYCDVEKLDEREIFWIKEFHSLSYENGYNITLGGNAPMRGRKHTEASKRKMSKPRKNWKLSEEGMKLRRDYMLSDKNPTKGRKRTDEEKKKMSEGRKGKRVGYKMTQETKDKISKAKTGVPRSKETKLKMSKAMKEWHKTHDITFSQEIKDKMSERMMGKKHGTGSSKFLGVSYITANKKWKAAFTYDRRDIYIGLFKTEIEAALAYNECVCDFYGYKARINHISKNEIIENWGDCNDKKNI